VQLKINLEKIKMKFKVNNVFNVIKTCFFEDWFDLEDNGVKERWEMWHLTKGDKLTIVKIQVEELSKLYQESKFYDVKHNTLDNLFYIGTIKEEYLNEGLEKNWLVLE